MRKSKLLHTLLRVLSLCLLFQHALVHIPSRNNKCVCFGSRSGSRSKPAPPAERVRLASAVNVSLPLLRWGCWGVPRSPRSRVPCALPGWCRGAGPHSGHCVPRPEPLGGQQAATMPVGAGPGLPATWKTLLLGTAYPCRGSPSLRRRRADPPSWRRVPVVLGGRSLGREALNRVSPVRSAKRL